MEGQAKPPRSPTGAFFAHPATLLLLAGAITALLSGLLVPYITHGWQTRDRNREHDAAVQHEAQQRRSAILHEELGVKSHLVNLIGGATAKFLSASQLHPYEKDAATAGLSEYDRAYGRWSTSSAEIASQLAAYFPDSSAARRWENFSWNMRNTYNLVRNHPGDERSIWLKQVGAYLKVPNSTINGILHKPLEGNSKSRNQTYEGALRNLLQKIQIKERFVVCVIVATPSSLRSGSHSAAPTRCA